VTDPAWYDASGSVCTESVEALNSEHQELVEGQAQSKRLVLSLGRRNGTRKRVAQWPATVSQRKPMNDRMATTMTTKPTMYTMLFMMCLWC
jgi:hypothetical protein